MINSLALLFNVARNRREFERLERTRAEEQRRERAENERREEDRRDKDDFDYLLRVTETQRQIALLEERMAQNYEILRATYGDDVIGGMASTWLSREEAAKLTTDEERMQALSEKFLNDDDSIKPPYAELVEARYVQDWSVLGKLQNDQHAEPGAEAATREPNSPGEKLVPF